MEAISLLVMVLVLLALIGVLIYIIQDYYKYKDATDSAINDAKAKLTEEHTNRLSNLKYVVDQVNTVNDDIYSTFTSNVTRQSSAIFNVSSNQSHVVTGLDSFLRFSSNESLLGGTPTQMRILDFPGVGNTNVDLIKRVSFTAGLTAKDLDASSMASFCSKSTPGKCIRFPNADGNTYLTSLAESKEIVLDAPTSITSPMYFKQNLADVSAQAATMTSLGSKMLSVQASRTAFGNSNYTPTATVEVRGEDASLPIFRVSTANNAGEAIRVDANGDVVLSKLTLKTSTPSDPAVTLLATPTGVTLDGNLHVTGNMTAANMVFSSTTLNGDLNVTGNISSTNATFTGDVMAHQVTTTF